jgi:hypothetical protein
LSSRPDRRAPSLQKLCSEDFSEVQQYLARRGLLGRNPSSVTLNAAKRLHGLAYSLSLWQYRIGRLPEHRRVFLTEVGSDAIQVLPQVLQGYRKTSTLLVRGVLENAVRHFFFFDHEVEYIRTNTETRWFPDQQQLFDYLRHQPLFVGPEKTFPAVKRLIALYDELSAHVHGRTLGHLEMRRALEEIKFDQVDLDFILERMGKLAASTSFLLALFHWSRVRALPMRERRILLAPIPSPGLRALAGMRS